MPNLSETDILRAELFEVRKEASATQQAHAQLRRTYEKLVSQDRIAEECLAVLMHKTGNVCVELSAAEKKVAWDATWLRVRLDVLEHDEEGIENSARLSLMVITE